MLELTFDAVVAARTCYAAAKLGIADLLANGARTSDDLAQELGVSPRALYRLLRALTMVDLITEAPGQRFALKELRGALQQRAMASSVL
jgi:DNA-binding IclR family transcriptional regulator